jgi:hypothetical protein
MISTADGRNVKKEHMIYMGAKQRKQMDKFQLHITQCQLKNTQVCWTTSGKCFYMTILREMCQFHSLQNEVPSTAEISAALDYMLEVQGSNLTKGLC